MIGVAFLSQLMRGHPVTLSVGGNFQAFANPADALPVLQPGIKVMLGTQTYAHYVAIEIAHRHFASVENSPLPPSIWLRDHYSWFAIWHFKLPIFWDVADNLEAELTHRFDGHRVNRCVPVPDIGGYCERVHWWKDRDVMPTDFDEIIVEAVPDDLVSATSAPQQRSWALEPIAQRKKTTLLSGEPGMGKSQIALAFAACVTRGKGLPGLADPEDGPAGVMVNETEDDWGEDVIPRLIAAGANRKLIRGFPATDLHTREGVGKLDSAKKKFESEIKKPVRMLILSPYMECFGGGSMQEHAMREKLREFKIWAGGQDIAILGVAHLNEKGDVAGSKTHKRAARGSWKVIADEEDPEKNPKKKRRLLVADKVNNTADDFAMAYRIKGVTLKEATEDGEDIETSKIVWEPLDALSKVEKCDEGIETPQTVTGKVMDHIKDRLQGGPVDSKTLIQEVIDMGYSEGVAHKAKKRLGIKPGGRGKSVPWELSK